MLAVDEIRRWFKFEVADGSPLTEGEHMGRVPVAHPHRIGVDRSEMIPTTDLLRHAGETSIDRASPTTMEITMRPPTLRLRVPEQR